MPAYQYQALTQSGASLKGIIEADGAKSAREKLRDKGLIIVEIQLLKSYHKTDKLKISRQNLSLITRQLATLLKARLTIEEALKGVAEQNDKPRIKEMILAIRDKVLEGQSLSQGLSMFPRVFSNLFVSTVAAGEQTGELSVILNRLADYVETQQKTQQKIQQALIYPSLMVFISTAIIIFLLTFVVPKIINVFDSTGQALPNITLILIDISTFLKNYGVFLIAFIVMFIFAIKYVLSRPDMKPRWHEFILKLPIISYISKTVNTARFSHTLAILSKAGVPILKSMKIATQLVNNLAIKSRLATARNAVKEGQSLALALRRTEVFNAMTLHLVASGENSGELEEMLEHAAMNQDNDINQLISTGLTLFEPLIILFMGAVVLFIVLATLLPIFSMDQLVH